MSSAALQAALDRLRVPHPAVVQAAAGAVLEALRAPGLSPAARDGAVAALLSSESMVTVETTVSLLVSPGAPQLGAPLQDLLLAALATAAPAAAPPLADGLLQLVACQADKGSAGAGTSGVAAAWRTHPLSKALLSNAGAAQPLVRGVARLLAAAANAADCGASFAARLAALRPFLSFLLLDEWVHRQHPLLAAQLHGALARCAAIAAAPVAQHALLRLLAEHLPALRLRGSNAQAAAAAALADVVDVVEACAEDPDTTTVAMLAAGLASLCLEAAAERAAALLQQALAALAHLAGYWPQTVAPHAADVGLLLVQHPLGSAETRAALALLAQLLQAAGGDGAAGGPELAAWLLLPLLPLVAFSGGQDVKQWAAHALAQLQQLGASGGGTSVPPPEPLAAALGSLHGAAVAAHASQHTLHRLWQHPLEARHWLAALQQELARPSAAGAGAGGGRAARDQRQLSAPTLLVLCALLQHPAEAVQRAALRAGVAAVEVTPLLGLTLLPLLVQLLQRQTERFLSGGWPGKQQRPSRLLLELLQALPAAGRHPAALPFVLRTLQQLLTPGAPEALQAVGLRLLSRLWQASGGRAYAQLRGAVIGYAAPGLQPGEALRVARAECLRDICTADPDKAAELVGLLQECVGDESPAVAAVGLDCIALLCEADVLEFYGAWRVVHRRLPRLPDHPGAGAAWLRLLGGGALDAAVQPEAAAAIVDALWLAAAHEAPQVRRQAYASLAAFRFDTLEEAGVLRPLWHFAALLRAELRAGEQLRQAARNGGSAAGAAQRQAAAALAECEALAAAALAHEHSTRRRSAALGPAGGSAARGRGGAAVGGSAAAAASHRLQSVLPKQLLGGAAASASDLLQRLPQVPAEAALYFFAPSPPPASTSKAAAAAAARHAAAEYKAVFEGMLRQQHVGAAAAGDAGAAGEALAAWSAFLRRWLAAARAAGKEQRHDPQQAAAHAALHVWEAVQAQLASGAGTPAAAANAVWAAAALCGCTPQPLPPLLTAVHSSLYGVAAGREAHPAAVQRAALAALGSLAEGVRVTLGSPVAQQLLALLQGRLAQPEAAAADAAAAAAGVGLACQALGGGRSELPPVAQQLVQGGLGSLAGALHASWTAAGGAALTAAAEADGLRLAGGAADLGAEAQPAVLAALAAALPAVVPALGLPSTLQALHAQLAAGLSQQADAGSPAAVLAASCTLLQAVAAAGFASGFLGGSDVASTLSLLLASASAAQGAAADGRVVGAAAAAAGSLLASALQRGNSPAEAGQPAAVLQQLMAVAEAAAKLSHAAAAKRGAAAGIASLLPSVDASLAAHQAAVATLERLALREGDPRTARTCAAYLAALCYAAKRGGGGGAGTASGGAAVDSASRALQQLPADGVLRPLLESLLEGRWALPAGEGQEAGAAAPLAPAEVAALLRCAAAAERLPAVSLGLVGARVLRSCREAPGGADVEAGLAALVAAHGSQQALQLSQLAGDLLRPASLAAAAPRTQLVLLARLPKLLAALPEVEAAGVLPVLVQHISQQPSGRHRRRLLLRLLEALAVLLAGGGAGSEVRGAAQGAVAELLLQPRVMPAPGRYAPLLAMHAEQGEAAAAPVPLQQRCWAAALRCLQLLPEAQREDLLRNPRLPPAHAAYAAGSLVASGTLDGRALQHPRNLVVQGAAAGRGGSGGGGMAAVYVGRAVACLPGAQQQQWLLDLLEACKACGDPAAAFQLAACIAASSAAASAAEAQLAADCALVAGSAAHAVATLPASLPLLLEGAAWQRSPAGVTLLLQRLAAALQHLAGGAQAGGASTPDWRQLLRRCLLATRHAAPPDAWPQLTVLL